MKYSVILISLAFIVGCGEQKKEYTHELHYPNTVITIAARETESDAFFYLRYGVAGTYSGSIEESSGRVYGTDVITNGIHVKYHVITSRLISNDGVTIIDGYKYTDLIPADVYLFQIKVPNEMWQTRTIVYTGEISEVITHPNIKITIE